VEIKESAHELLGRRISVHGNEYLLTGVLAPEIKDYDPLPGVPSDLEKKALKDVIPDHLGPGIRVLDGSAMPKLGKGVSGVVFQAKCNLPTDVAIKCTSLPKNLEVSNANKLVAEWQRMKGIAFAQAKLDPKDPCSKRSLRGAIAPLVYDMFPAVVNKPPVPGFAAAAYKKSFCLVMELLQGSTLNGWILKHKDDSKQVKAAMYAKVETAVKCFHALGYEHNDLHDKNIWVDINGNVRLLDLGESTDIEAPKVLEKSTVEKKEKPVTMTVPISSSTVSNTAPLVVDPKGKPSSDRSSSPPIVVVVDQKQKEIIKLDKDAGSLLTLRKDLGLE